LVSNPFKQAVFTLVDEITPQALNCRAINLIYKLGGKLIGDNRDGEAFLTGAKSAHSFDFKGKRMLFFGCGGVSSAIAVTLSETLNGIGLIDPCCERIKSLEVVVHRLNPSLQIETFDAAPLRKLSNFDVLYNGTGLGKGINLGLTEQSSPLNMDDILPPRGAAFDANYTPEKPLFLEQLEALGFSVFNGLSHMLASTAIHLSLVTGADLTYNSVESIYRKMIASQPKDCRAC
jgi:shikimate dehydrogenase